MGEGQQRFLSRWAMFLRSGSTGQGITPRANEPMWVTDVYLVDPASAVGQGAVDACLKIGDRNILLASLSWERPWAELQNPVILDQRFFLQVMPPHDDDDDAVFVQFEGFAIVPLPSPAPESTHGRGGQAEAVSSEDGGNRADEKHADEETNREGHIEERRRSATARLTRAWQRGAASRLTRCG